MEFADRTNLSMAGLHRSHKSGLPTSDAKTADWSAEPEQSEGVVVEDHLAINLELCFELNALLDRNKELVDALQALRAQEKQLSERTERATEATRQLGLEELTQRNAQLLEQLSAGRAELTAREGELRGLNERNSVAVRELDEKNHLVAAQQMQLAELERRETELRASLDIQGSELAAVITQDKAMEERLQATEQQTAQLRQQQSEFLATKAQLEELLAQTPLADLAEEVELLQQSIARVESDNRQLLEALGETASQAMN